jgi:hypothetical protein
VNPGSLKQRHLRNNSSCLTTDWLYFILQNSQAYGLQDLFFIMDVVLSRPIIAPTSTFFPPSSPKAISYDATPGTPLVSAFNVRRISKNLMNAPDLGVSAGVSRSSPPPCKRARHIAKPKKETNTKSAEKRPASQL